VSEDTAPALVRRQLLRRLDQLIEKVGDAAERIGDLLHAQQIGQNRIVTQRRDVGVTLVPAKTESFVVPSTSRFSDAFGLV
jgi:hypothetical protein